MKPIKFSKKLRFTKETVADLNSKEMNEVHAGMPDLQTRVCTPTQCPSGGLPCKGC